MPIARFQLPDGRVARFEVPEGTTPEQAQSMMANHFSQQQKPVEKEESFFDKIKQGAGNLLAGGVRGAGSIGATILAPIDMIGDAMDGKGLSLESNRRRRQAMDEGLASMGAETDSMLYQGGKLGGEIAGTMGAGGVLANALRHVAPNAGRAITALSTSGMRTGAPAATTFGGKAADLGIRAGAGAASGAASAGLVNPDDAGVGALIGGGFPVAGKALGAAGQKIGSAVRGGSVSNEVADLAKRAAALGIDVPADRIANSKPLNAIAAALNYVPFSGRAGTEARMGKQLNTALTRTFGQDSDNVTQALRKADEVLGGQFDEVLKSNKVKVDEEFLQALANAEQRASRELETGQAAIIHNQIEEILTKANATGEIDGQAAYNIKKTLDRISKQNSPQAFYAEELRKDLMSALNRSLPPETAKAFAKTRQQYGNMIEVRKLAQNGADGDVSIARVGNMKNLRNKDLQELADISAQFLKAREGQHGAAQRAAAGLGVGGFAGLPALAGTVAAGRFANAGLNSQAAKNFILGGGGQQEIDQRLLQALYQMAPQLNGQ